MARRILRYNAPDRFIAATIGEPGKRVFHLQALEGGRSTTVIVEKSQVAILARRIAEMLRDLGEGSAIQLPTAGSPLQVSTPQLIEPIEPEFRVGTIALAWDPSLNRLILEFRDDMNEEDVSDAPPPMNDAPDGPDVLRVALSVEAALAFAEASLQAAAAGRPLCPNCGAPLEVTGHRCVRKAAYLN